MQSPPSPAMARCAGAGWQSAVSVVATPGGDPATILCLRGKLSEQRQSQHDPGDRPVGDRPDRLAIFLRPAADGEAAPGGPAQGAATAAATDAANAASTAAATPDGGYRNGAAVHAGAQSGSADDAREDYATGAGQHAWGRLPTLNTSCQQASDELKVYTDPSVKMVVMSTLFDRLDK